MSVGLGDRNRVSMGPGLNENNLNAVRTVVHFGLSHLT